MKKIAWGIFAVLFAVAASLPLGLFPGRAIPVLMYHHISSEKGSGALEVSVQTLEGQLRFLKEHHYDVVSPHDLAGFIRANEKPRKTVALTFDDGNEDNYQNALPALEKHGFKGIFFIVTDWVGKPGFMNWDQIRDLKKRGHTIGSHTQTHAFLTEIGLAKAKDEIYNSKRLMHENLGSPVDALCYPAGRFNTAIKTLVKEAGYETAFATAPGWAYSNRELMAIKRIRVSESSNSPIQFWWRVAGYYNLFRERTARRMRG